MLLSFLLHSFHGCIGLPKLLELQDQPQDQDRERTVSKSSSEESVVNTCFLVLSLLSLLLCFQSIIAWNINHILKINHKKLHTKHKLTSWQKNLNVTSSFSYMGPEIEKTWLMPSCVICFHLGILVVQYIPKFSIPLKKKKAQMHHHVGKWAFTIQLVKTCASLLSQYNKSDISAILEIED